MAFDVAGLNRFSQDRKGSVAIVFALTAIPVFGIIGLGIDVGRAMNARERLQAAMDAAVVAATRDTSGEPEAAAQRFFDANASSIGGRSASASFTINGDGDLVGSASLDVPTTILQIMRFDKVAVSAQAVAKASSTTTTTVTETITKQVVIPGQGHCIHVLDQNATESLKLINNRSLTAETCEIHVRANSSVAIKTQDEVAVTWKKLLVKGSGGNTSGELDIIKDAPKAIQYNYPVVGDPYTDYVQAVVRALPNASCPQANRNKTFTNQTVSPGVYCGTTTFDGVTFNPGLYTIIASGNDGGRLILKGRLDGSAGVSFYIGDNKSALHSYQASEGTYLKALESGLTQGLLFFEASNRGSTWSASINSLARNTWDGVIYLPSANLTIKNWTADADRTMTFGIVANQLQMENWTGTIKTYQWTPFGYSKPINLPDETITVTETVTKEVTTSSPGRLTN
jgi:Flp pilus assembly protein TadG